MEGGRASGVPRPWVRVIPQGARRSRFRQRRRHGVRRIPRHPVSPAKRRPDLPFNWAAGAKFARYRDSFSEPKPLEPGKVYELVILLHPCANRFVAGHRVRVDVTSSCFPTYDPNRNTGRPNDRTWRIANNMVHHDSSRASCVELSVME